MACDRRPGMQSMADLTDSCALPAYSAQRNHCRLRTITLSCDDKADYREDYLKCDIGLLKGLKLEGTFGGRSGAKCCEVFLPSGVFTSQNRPVLSHRCNSLACWKW